MSHTINRRSLLSLLPAWLVAPRPATARPASNGRIKTLDPSDPVAVELAEMYDHLRSFYAPEVVANRALEAEMDRICDRPEGMTVEQMGDRTKELMDALHAIEYPRRRAWGDLLDAVVEASGAEEITPADWYAYGTPFATVRVGDRIYSVCSDIDADYEGLADGTYGLAEVVVIEL